MGNLPPWPWREGASKGEIINSREDACVGAWVLVYDANNRVYDHDANGRSMGGALERYHYVPWKILGETRVSWLLSPIDGWPLDRCTKRPKKPADGKLGFYGLEDVEDKLWTGSHRFKISELLRRVEDRSLLERVAQIIGYREERA